MNNPIYGIVCLYAILIFILIVYLPPLLRHQIQQQQECVTISDDSELEIHFGGKGRERIQDDKIYKNYFKY